MMRTEHEINEENGRLKKIAINLRLDLNAANKRIRRLEKVLSGSSRKAEVSMGNTKLTFGELTLLEEAETDNKYSPYDTGMHKINPWGRKPR